MQKNISCFEVLEELYEENIDDKILRQIKFDIALAYSYFGCAEDTLSRHNQT